MWLEGRKRERVITNSSLSNMSWTIPEGIQQHRSADIHKTGGVCDMPVGVGLFFAKKLVRGDMPLVEAFLSCLTPLLSITLAFLCLSLSEPPSTAFATPLPFRRMPKVDCPEMAETELADEVVDKGGVGRPGI